MVVEDTRAGLGKYLLPDMECDKLTNRMQMGLKTMVAAMPKNLGTVNLVDYMYKLVFTASVYGLYSDELAKDDLFFDHFIEFDKVFALTVAGIPISMFNKGNIGRDYCIQRMIELLPNGNSNVIDHRTGVYQANNIEGTDRGGNTIY